MLKISFLVLIFFSFSEFIYAGDDLIFQKQSFEDSYNDPIQEKIFLHIDRSGYLAGETLWFKVNVVDSENHKPLDLSKVVYIEIVDKNNETPIQTKVSISKGFGDGAVYLPLSLKSGNYLIRAYTSWMKNFGPETFFEEELSIVNTFHKMEQVVENIRPTLDIQFFPEGGQLVYGLRSKVAFRVVNQNGKGVDFEGAIINDSKDTISLFKPSKFGIGYFYYTPEENIAVKAIIKTNSDSIVSSAMPAPVKKGFIMHVSDASGEELTVSIESDLNIRENLSLVSSAYNGEKLIEKKPIEDGKAVFSIDKNSMAEGVSQITIYDSQNKPLVERLYFKYPSRELKIKVNPHKDSFSKREKVNLNISIPENNNTNLVSSNLSMAIYQLDSLNKVNAQNIHSYLWLSSDLKGKIESPAHYFTNINGQTIVEMNNLMLTHGWRKFQIEDNSQASEGGFSFLPEYEGLVIKGSIKNNPSESALLNIPFYLATTGAMSQLYGSKSDDQGNFYFVTKSIFGQQKLVIQTNQPNLKKISGIKLEDPYFKSYTNRSLPPLFLTPTYHYTLSSRHIHMQTQNVYWGEEKNQVLTSAIDSLHFYDKIDQSYLLDDYTRFPTMEEVMREYIPEVVVRKQAGNFYFRVLKAPHEVHIDEPLVLINNIPVFDMNKIIEYNPLLIKQVDIISDGFILEGEIVLKGIINYKTYTNKLEDVELDPTTTVVDYEGLQLPRAFYSPMYGDDENANQSKPDFRNLLFWEPTIIINGSETKELSFYTSDLSGKYIGIIQGLNENGETGYTSFTFEVNEAFTRE